MNLNLYMSNYIYIFFFLRALVFKEFQCRNKIICICICICNIYPSDSALSDATSCLRYTRPRQAHYYPVRLFTINTNVEISSKIHNHCRSGEGKKNLVHIVEDISQPIYVIGSFSITATKMHNIKEKKILHGRKT